VMVNLLQRDREPASGRRRADRSQDKSMRAFFATCDTDEGIAELG
jgi:hypothetical protein